MTPPAAGFQRPRDDGVIGGGETHETVHPLAAAGQCRNFQLFGAVVHVLHVEPHGLKSAVHAEHLHQVVVDDASRRPDHQDFPSPEPLFDRFHGVVCLAVV